MPHRRPLILVLTGFGALLMACYSPVLFRGQQFGFRDAGSFYYPLYQRVQQEWDAGRRAALGDGGERRDAAPGKSDGGRALPVEGDLRGPAVCLGCKALRRGPYGPSFRGDAGAHEVLADELDGLGPERPDVCLRRAGAVPVLQRHLPGRGRVAAARRARGRSLGPSRPALGADRAGYGPGDANAGRRAAIGLPARTRGDGVCRGPGVASRGVAAPRRCRPGTRTSRAIRLVLGRFVRSARDHLDVRLGDARLLGAAVAAGRVAAETAALDGRSGRSRARGVGGRRGGVRGLLGVLVPAAAWLADAAGGRLARIDRLGGDGGPARCGAAPAGRRVHPADRPRRRGTAARYLRLQHGADPAGGPHLAGLPRRLVRAEYVLGRPRADAGPSATGLGPFALPGRHDDRARGRGLRPATGRALARLGLGHRRRQPDGQPGTVRQPDLGRTPRWRTAASGPRRSR